MIDRPDRKELKAIIHRALCEDAPWGDITSQSLLPAQARVEAELVARENGVFCGQDVVALAMELTDPATAMTFFIQDGERFDRAQVIARISGQARTVLQAERVALNFTQRLSGIATMTAAYVAETRGTRCRIVDTRKTTPGLRLLERYAVRCGGHNHRFSLSDAFLAKDNHLAVVMKDDSVGLTQYLKEAFAQLPHTIHREVEVDRMDQIEPVLAAGTQTILLDNFSIDDMRRSVQLIAGRACVEASGGIVLERVREIAETGVDLISVGALTHSVRALDMGLDIAVHQESRNPH